LLFIERRFGGLKATPETISRTTGTCFAAIVILWRNLATFSEKKNQKIVQIKAMMNLICTLSRIEEKFLIWRNMILKENS
jgi:hypothetical protein